MQRLTGCGKGSSTGPAVVVIAQLWKRSKRRKDGESFQWGKTCNEYSGYGYCVQEKMQELQAAQEVGLLIADESGGGETSGRK